MTPSAEPATTVRSERAPRADTTTRPGLAIGTNVGRYVVLGVAGQGGFGVVYRAYDPELDRKIALKLLDERADEDPAVRREVLAEARAMAKLRHRNIVAVYDVGEHEGRGFVAMEYVDGVDLRAWLGGESRPWPMIARVMARAARGLAAAHEAGIVHRDFKPSNVLVDSSGQVYVADFGLARAMRRDDDGPKDADELPPGSPPYLAPELYDGAEATPASDAFAFCVSLWEAAFGERPWTDEDETELLEAKRKGPPSAARSGVPSSVVAVLRAGLSPDPTARPQSMTALAEALEHDGGKRGWGIAVVASLGAIAAVGLWLRADDPCAEAAVAVDAVWNEETRDGLAERIGTMTLANTAETVDRLEQNVDAWVERWRSERLDACQATHVRREQSAGLLDLRMACLDRELSQLTAVLELVREGDAELVASSPRAVAKLGRGLSCDRESVQATDRDPKGPEVDAVVADLDRIAVDEAVARYEEGLARITDVETRAEALGAQGLLLQARYRHARLLDLTGDAKAAVELHEQTHWDAEAGDWDEVAMSAGLDVMYEYAAVLGKPDVALSWAPHVRAAIRRAGGDERPRATLVDFTGIAHLYLGDVEAAAKSHEEALALREAYDDDGLDTVATLQNLGIAYEELHRYDDAIAQQERARDILVRLVGEHHPHTARVQDNLGTALLRKGDLAAATENFRRALEIRRSVLGPQHRSVALSHLHLAHAALEGDDHARAIEGFTEALALYTEIGGSEARETLLCHEGLAHAHQAAGDIEAAKKHAGIALRGFAGKLPEEHPEMVGLRAILDETL